MSELPEHVRRNRAHWDDRPAATRAAGQRNWAERRADLGDLGRARVARSGCCPTTLDGLDAIELGCGTGYVSAWLARRGARPVGIDNSRGAARHRARASRSGTASTSRCSTATPRRCRFPTRASTSRSPSTARASGATPTVDPRGRPAAAPRRRARLPRQLGAADALLPRRRATAPAGTELLRPQFGMHRFEWPDDDSVEFHLAHGEMIAAAARHRLRGRGADRGQAAAGCDDPLRPRHPRMGAELALRGGLEGAQALTARPVATPTSGP